MSQEELFCPRVICPLHVCHYLSGQIIEYEDYDSNSTDDYQVKEYEYEEEYDDRYGPAERERAFTVNSEVQNL